MHTLLQNKQTCVSVLIFHFKLLCFTHFDIFFIELVNGAALHEFPGKKINKSYLTLCLQPPAKNIHF